MSVAISLDGPAHIHDIHRRTFQGTGTHAAVERAARMLVSRDIGVSALAVCNPAYPPRQYVEFFASCGIANYDIMIPDATVDEKPASIASFYNGLFDLWLEANRSKPTANIRIVTDMITALLANNSPTEGVGYQARRALHCHDRWLGGGARRAAHRRQRRHSNDVQHLRSRHRRGEARAALAGRPRRLYQSLRKCRNCKFMNACGGGYLPHRFSKKNGYDNPSVYCDDLYAMFENMQSVLEQQLYVSKPGGERLSLQEALPRA